MISRLQLRRHYFPAWARALAARWVWADGRLTPRPGAEETEVVAAVAGLAARMAQAEHRAAEPDDLRRGCNAISLQRARSHRCGQAVPLVLTNEGVSSRQLDQLSFGLVRSVFFIIEEPTWLGAERSGNYEEGLLDWESPARIERRVMEWVIKERTVPGYAARVSKDLHGTALWQELEFKQLQELYVLLRCREKAWA